MEKYFWTSHLFAFFVNLLSGGIGEESHNLSNEV